MKSTIYMILFIFLSIPFNTNAQKNKRKYKIFEGIISGGTCFNYSCFFSIENNKSSHTFFWTTPSCTPLEIFSSGDAANETKETEEINMIPSETNDKIYSGNANGMHVRIKAQKYNGCIENQRNGKFERVKVWIPFEITFL